MLPLCSEKVGVLTGHPSVQLFGAVWSDPLATAPSFPNPHPKSPPHIDLDFFRRLYIDRFLPVSHCRVVALVAMSKHTPPSLTGFKSIRFLPLKSCPAADPPSCLTLTRSERIPQRMAPSFVTSHIACPLRPFHFW